MPLSTTLTRCLTAAEAMHDSNLHVEGLRQHSPGVRQRQGRVLILVGAAFNSQIGQDSEGDALLSGSSPYALRLRASSAMYLQHMCCKCQQILDLQAACGCASRLDDRDLSSRRQA